MLGIGTLTYTPRHQCVADCELAAEAHNAHPHESVADCRDTDNTRQPTRSVHCDDDSREAGTKPHQSEQAANDADCAWRLIARTHGLPMSNGQS